MIKIKLADKNDFDFFYQIKSTKDNMIWSGHKEKPEYDSLMVFYNNIILNHDDPLKRKIYISWIDIKRCGYLYFDPIDLCTASVSIAIMDEDSGKGYGKVSLQSIAQVAIKSGYKRIIAEIREDNIRSKHLFKSVGFIEDNKCRLVKIDNINREVKMIQYSLNLGEG